MVQSLGWDEDWTNVSLGSSTEDLDMQGLYIEAGFSNISDSATRTLDSIKVGTPSMTGPISATFQLVQRAHRRRTGVPVVVGGRPIRWPPDNHTVAQGRYTATMMSSTCSFQRNRELRHGWWFFWKNATVN